LLLALLSTACQSPLPPRSAAPARDAVAAGSAPAAYEFVDLGRLNGWSTVPTVINDAGLVGGFAAYSPWEGHAFQWDGVLHDYGTLEATIKVTGLNHAGVMIGNGEVYPPGSGLPGNVPHAVRWEPGDATPQELGTLGGDASTATGINAQGVIVGASWRAGSHVWRAFSWSDGTFTELGTLGGAQSSAADVNDAGMIVGWAETVGDSQHAFLWHAGAMQDLGVLSGWTGTAATHINARGQVIGTATLSGNPFTVGQRAFFWSNGTMQDLGTFGGDWTVATAIDDQGRVAGWGRDDTPDHWSHAFSWERGVLTPLDEPGMVASEADAMNDATDIAGWALFYRNGSLARTAVVWVGGQAIELPNPLGGPASATAINARGDIVGVVGGHAVLWRRTEAPLAAIEAAPVH
jgi:probable HAF family extracellular repeat protein